MNSIILWTLIGWHIFGILVTISTVGKERKPLTSGLAAGTTALSAVIIGLLLYVVTHGGAS